MTAMRAMVLDAPRAALRPAELPVPAPGRGEVLVRVRACAVCRTDLHVVDGELPHPKLPLVPGHEIAGTVAAVGEGATGFAVGDRVGVPWLGATCGHCRSLSDRPGEPVPRGAVHRLPARRRVRRVRRRRARFCFPLPAGYTDTQAAPLLCAGLIGYRALTLAGDAARLGLYGFGAAAHLVAQVARHQGRRVFAFTRAGDAAGQRFARELGAEWAGASADAPPEPLDAALIFAPVGALVPAALRAVAPGGTVVCAGIHMSDIPAFPYALLWGERVVRSVANLTRRDGEAFLALAPRVPVRTHVQTFPLEEANAALDRLRAGQLTGAAVLEVAPPAA